MKNLSFILTSLIIVLCLVTTALSQGDMTVSRIVTQLQKSSFSDIEDYIVDIRAELDMENVQIPPMEVKVWFRKPNKIHMESDGFAMLPREGLIIDPGHFNEENFYITITGMDTIDSRPAYALDLVPKKEEIRVKKIAMWVSAEPWLIVKIRAAVWQGHASEIFFQYSTVDDKYHLPASARAEISMPPMGGVSPDMSGSKEESVKEDKKGTLTIEFRNYRINTGFSDDIFGESNNRD
ncbi:MAG: hypothetical protein V2J62_05540 [candidate division KSB1 bacterium]|jgi:outer membrane lipoprotein-sorting protein|nr:hypothetical protein [candidate division KSB1 bacterium]